MQLLYFCILGLDQSTQLTFMGIKDLISDNYPCIVLTVIYVYTSKSILG